MTTKSLSPANSTRQLVEELGAPFAQALGAFIVALQQTQVPSHDPMRASRDQLEPELTILDPSDVPPEIQRRFDASYAANRAAEQAGTVKRSIFNPNDFARSMSQRIRAVAKSQGVSQSELARRLKVTPAVVSRVFQRPDCARVDTIRRIAVALDVPIEHLI